MFLIPKRCGLFGQLKRQGVGERSKCPIFRYITWSLENFCFWTQKWPQFKWLHCLSSNWVSEYLAYLCTPVSIPHLNKLVSHLWIKLLACVRSPAFAGWPFIQWLLQTTSLQRKLSSSHALNCRRRLPPPHAPAARRRRRRVTPSLVSLADRQIAHATTVKVKSESNFCNTFSY